MQTLARAGVTAHSEFVVDLLPAHSDDGGEGAAAGDGAVSAVVVVDPLSLAGQRAAGLLQLLREQLHIPVTLVLLPLPDLSSFPLQSFYRSSTGLRGGPALMTGLPRQHTLTVRVDHPEGWNVQAAESGHDLDNLVCDAVSCGDDGSDVSRARYTLRGLLVSGQCYQGVREGAPSPPNGLQLVLTDRFNGTGAGAGAAVGRDTLVMKNLGYFQLQASPGVWDLSIAAGRGATLFGLDSGAGADDGTGPGTGAANANAGANANAEVTFESSKTIAVNTFSSRMHSVFVTKRPGLESVPLLEDPASAGATTEGGASAGGGVFSTLKNMFATPDAQQLTTASTDTSEDGKLHVFSLATGHVYERLLRIMMLSVHKTSSRPVKVAPSPTNTQHSVHCAHLHPNHLHRWSSSLLKYSCLPYTYTNADPSF
jgi:UDP-glucose:glycoprotein glucosyltransferase